MAGSALLCGEVAQEIVAMGGQAEAVEADLADPASAPMLFDPGHRLAGKQGQLGQPVAFGAGSATDAGPPRSRQPVQARVGAQPGGDGHLLGEAAQRLAGIGAVHD